MAKHIVKLSPSASHTILVFP